MARTEFYDEPDVLEGKMNALTKLVKDAKHLVIYTGAGISTAASIPDYRGDKGLANNPVPMVVLGLKEKDMDFTMPTYSHCAITELVNRGVCKFVATSNHDGLHQKSGLDDKYIADVFGNLYTERCRECKRYWRRKVVVPTLGRECDDPNCKGRLQKCGTRFGGQTPPEPLGRAEDASDKADVALVLGSSMSVSPFCNLPMMAKKTVLVNLQTTIADRECFKINADCDMVMRRLMSNLGLSLKKYTYEQRYHVQVEASSEGSNIRYSISIKGDPDRPSEPPTAVAGAELFVSQTSYDLEKSRDGSYSCNFTVPAQFDDASKPEVSAVMTARMSVTFAEDLVLDDKLISIPLPRVGASCELVQNCQKHITF